MSGSGFSSQPGITSIVAVVATTSVATPAASTTLGPRLGLVDGESTSIMIAAIQCLDRYMRLVVIGHLDEAESSTTARVPVDQDLCRAHGTELCEQLLELLGSDSILEVPDVKPHRHGNRPLRALLRPPQEQETQPDPDRDERRTNQQQVCGIRPQTPPKSSRAAVDCCHESPQVWFAG